MIDATRIPVAVQVKRALYELGDPATEGDIADLIEQPRSDIRRALRTLSAAGECATTTPVDTPAGQHRWLPVRHGKRAKSAAFIPTHHITPGDLPPDSDTRRSATPAPTLAQTPDKTPMENTLIDLNDRLFAQLDRLADAAPDDLAKEVNRSKAVCGIAQQIIANGQLVLDASKAVSADLIDDTTPLLGND